MEELRFDFGKKYVVLDYKVKKLQRESAARAEFLLDPETFVVTLSLFNSDGLKLNETSYTLPLGTLIVSAELDYENKKLVFNTEDGSTIDCDIAVLINTISDIDERLVTAEDTLADVVENAVYKDDNDLVPLDNLPKEYNTDFKVKAAAEATEPNEAFNSKSLILQNSVMTMFEPQPATYSMSSPVLTNAMQTLFFSADGLKVFTIDTGTDIIYQYVLNTAWEVDTINSVAEATFAITSAIEGTANGMYIKPDGTRLFFIGSGNKKVYSLTLATPWSLVGATTIVSSTALPGLGNKALTALAFSDDGTKVYISNSTDDAVNIFSLSIPWDITSQLTSLGNISVSAQETSPIGIYLGDNGTKLYVVGSDSDKVHQYTMNTPWGTSAAYTGKTVATQQNTTTCVNFRPDGKRMFLIGTTTKQIDAYILDTAWDLTGGDPVEIPLNEKFYVNSTAEINTTNSKLKVSYQANDGAVTSLLTIDKEGRIETPDTVLKTSLSKIDNGGDRDLLIESNGAYFNLGRDGDTYINAGNAGINLTGATGVRAQNLKIDNYTIISIDNGFNSLYLGDDYTELTGTQVYIVGGPNESSIHLSDVIEFNSYTFKMLLADDGLTFSYNNNPIFGAHGGGFVITKKLQNASYTTATRPSMSTGYEVGTQIYDTTLGKPIWWNGTDWTDAMGTVV